MATRKGERTEPTGREQGVRLPGLRRARKEAGYSVRELAEKSGVARSTISYLELGERSAQGRTARALAEALGVKRVALTREPGEASEDVASGVGMVAMPAPSGEHGDDADTGEEGGDIEALARARARREGVSVNEALRSMFQEYAIISGHAPLPTRYLPSGAPRERRKKMSRPDAAAAAVSASRGE